MQGFRAPLAVAALVVLPVLVLQPFQNVPMNDDWVYAWSVEHLLTTGSLRILDFSALVNVAQVIWGALFCLPFGFSFTALRVSTWVLALLGLWGFYLLLRELGVRRRDSAIGTATLGLSPYYVLLSFSFMTDVPAITGTTWALLCFTRALASGRRGWLAAASACAMLAIATRLSGVAIPLGLGAFLLFRTGPRVERSVAALAVTVLPLLFTGGLMWWQSSHTEVVAGSALEGRLDDVLQYGFTYLHEWLLFTVVYVAPALGVIAAPVALTVAVSPHVRRVGIALGCMALAFVIGSATGLAPFQEHGATWTLGDFISSHRLVPGAGDYASSPAWVVATGVAGTLLFCLAAGPATAAGTAPAAVTLRWLLVTQAGMSAVLWLWDVRYMLTFLPPFLALVLAAGPIRRVGVAVGAITVFALLAVGALHDEVRFNRALWAAVDHLRAQRAPVSRINGGYMVNGWLQYAHPENAKVDENGTPLVEWVNWSSDDFDYQVSNRPQAGWQTLETFPYAAWLGPDGALYALARRER